ncbi:MAG: effector binding domain-containing protein [Defluviitaleaceae bacterium]|nr:effector binding domain-containing protein [Defluviitaleaceae bacterium]
MNQLQPISTVAKSLGVSSRTLRYYEQIGLINSNRMENYTYRAYDEETIRRLRQIIILRKLRVPVKQIHEIFSNSDAVCVIDIFERNISELDEQITALATVKSILSRLVHELYEKANMRLQLDFLGDSSVFAVVDSVSFPRNIIHEEKSISELNQASEKLNKLTDKDVRVIYLPPSEVAAYQFEGEEPEQHVGQAITKFVLDNNLPQLKPDLRHYGFNAPNPLESDPTGAHGYEMWVTIPDGFTVPAPFTKKYFCGGLYAAHMIPAGAFEEWGWLMKWVLSNAKYEFNGDWNNPNQWGCLEETLNYTNRIKSAQSDGLQLDLLVPIKERK